jgi:hypothetical protein
MPRRGRSSTALAVSAGRPAGGMLPSMSLDSLRSLLRQQAGVVSRRQVLAVGCTDGDIERWIRRRDLAGRHAGVYVDHTGPPTWLQRAWAAVLFAWPAALSHDSALGSAVPDRDRFARRPASIDGSIHVAVDRTRRVVDLDGVKAHRVIGFDAKVLWNVGPPRMRVEEAALDAAASRPTPIEALAVVADACQAGLTTPERVRSALLSRRRMRHGAWLRACLDDIVAGVRSVLEHRYLARVERAHGLPRGRRQGAGRLPDGPSVWRDVEYPDLGLVVELDGRFGHVALLDRGDDLDRDLATWVAGRRTVRLSWAQVCHTPCRTAAAVARLLQSGGWKGRPRPCGPGCRVRAEA